jgi:protein-S-isoprenylcysteine O-methyltransferase Ste14
MNDEQSLRLAVLAIAAVVFPIGVYHRVRSQATREPLDRRQEGWFILLTLRPTALVSAIGVIAYLWDPSSMTWSSIGLPMRLRWAGIGLCALGGALLLWAFRRLGNNLTDTVVTRRAHTLVTGGPYRFVRHPFYDSVALFVAGIAIAAANWFIMAAGGVAIALLVVRTRIEEEKLLARFGDSYRAYVARTGRFLPKLGT